MGPQEKIGARAKVPSDPMLRWLWESLLKVTDAKWATVNARVSNSNSSEGHIPIKKCFEGRSLLKKAFMGRNLQDKLSK
jgi:hypothetical protein